MQIKINEKILSIPPYISTNWSSIASIHMKEEQLYVILLDDTEISLPGLQMDVIERIFTCHAAYLESDSFESPMTQMTLQHPFSKEDLFSALAGPANPLSMQIGIGSIDGIGNAMQHNPEQSNAPDLPSDLLHKIAAVSKILKNDEVILPTAHPECNCFHCQIARVLNPNSLSENEIEESISDSELNFQQWDIIETGENVFSVVSRLDNDEAYSVFLGQPVVCTCGKEGCDHIIAVLKS